MPPSPKERIAYLEGKVEEHSRGFDDLRMSINRVDGQLVGLDGKVDRFRDALDRKMSRQFSWLVGVQVTVLMVVPGSLLQ